MQTFSTNRSDFLAQLDDAVPGNHTAKEMLVDLVFFHQRLTQLIDAGVKPETLPAKPSPLLIGSEIIGTSTSAKTIAQSLNRPVHEVNARDFSDAGHVGLSVLDMVTGLLDQANGNIEAAEHGVVLIHNVDAQKRRDLAGQLDARGEAFQSAMIPLIKGTSVTRQKGSDRIHLRTHRMLFIATGSFEDLKDTARRRVLRGCDHDDNDRTECDILSTIDVGDLVDFGFIPDFATLFSLIPIQHPTASQLHQFQQRDSSPLASLRRFFAIHGIRLVVEAEGLDAIIADHAPCTNAHIQAALLRTLHAEVGQVDELRQLGVGEVYVDTAAIRKQLSPWRVPARESAKAEVDELLARVTPAPQGITTKPGISNTHGWTEIAIQRRLDEVRQLIGYDTTTGPARKFWDAFEEANSTRKTLVLQLTEELAIRHATISEFFLAYVYSNTDNIQANLHFLDYCRIKKVEQSARRAANSKSQFCTGETCPPACEGEFCFAGWTHDPQAVAQVSPDAGTERVIVRSGEKFPPHPQLKRPCYWKQAPIV